MHSAPATLTRAAPARAPARSAVARAPPVAIRSEAQWSLQPASLPPPDAVVGLPFGSTGRLHAHCACLEARDALLGKAQGERLILLPATSGGDARWTLARSRASGDGVGGLLLSLSGVASRARAEAMRGAQLWRAPPSGAARPPAVPLHLALRADERGALARAAAVRAEAAAAAAERLPPVPAELQPASGPSASGDAEVALFWDLDNLAYEAGGPPPRALAAALRATAARHGTVRSLLAFANRHAFSWTPAWAAQQAKEERAAEAQAAGLRCPLCARSCDSPAALRSHFAHLHGREERKRNRGRSGSGSAAPAPLADSIPAAGADRAWRYAQASAALFAPARGNRLAWSLSREGVEVRTVESQPQAADAALESALRSFLAQRAPGAPPACVVLVSDDSGFAPLLHWAAQQGATVVAVSTRPPVQPPMTGDALGASPRIRWAPWREVCQLARSIQQAGPPALDAAWGLAADAQRPRKAGAARRVPRGQATSWASAQLVAVEGQTPPAVACASSKDDPVAALAASLGGVLTEAELKEDGDDFHIAAQLDPAGASADVHAGEGDGGLAIHAALAADAAMRVASTEKPRAAPAQERVFRSRAQRATAPEPRRVEATPVAGAGAGAPQDAAAEALRDQVYDRVLADTRGDHEAAYEAAYRGAQVSDARAAA